MKHNATHSPLPTGSGSTRPATGPAVVVGVDTPRTFEAVDWAAAEAAARGSPLRIVHALQPAIWPTPIGAALPLWLARQEAGELLLRRAAVRARSVVPDIRLSTHLIQAPTRQALYDQARQAGLLVLGSRAPSATGERSGGSLAAHAAAHAPCAVVVVPPAESHDDAADASESGARIVLGIDRDPASALAAIPFAFRAAHQRGIPLTVVHVVSPDHPADIEAISAFVGEREETPNPASSEFRTMFAALAPWRAAFPDVLVAVSVVSGDPTRALISAAEDAALTVVGSRGRGRVRAALLGSVSRRLLHHATGPVAIVRHDHALVPAADATQGAAA
jgi:nucleotide-binding universal stress UspA family protein